MLTLSKSPYPSLPITVSSLRCNTVTQPGITHQQERQIPALWDSCFMPRVTNWIVWGSIIYLNTKIQSYSLLFYEVSTLLLKYTKRRVVKRKKKGSASEQTEMSSDCWWRSSWKRRAEPPDHLTRLSSRVVWSDPSHVSAPQPHSHVSCLEEMQNVFVWSHGDVEIIHAKSLVIHWCFVLDTPRRTTYWYIRRTDLWSWDYFCCESMADEYTIAHLESHWGISEVILLQETWSHTDWLETQWLDTWRNNSINSTCYPTLDTGCDHLAVKPCKMIPNTAVHLVLNRSCYPTAHRAPLSACSSPG